MYDASFVHPESLATLAREVILCDTTVRSTSIIQYGFNCYEFERYDLHHSHADASSLYENDNTLD